MPKNQRLTCMLKYQVEKDARPRLKLSNLFIVLDLFLGLNYAQNIELGTNKALKLLAINT